MCNFADPYDRHESQNECYVISSLDFYLFDGNFDCDFKLFSRHESLIWFNINLLDDLVTTLQVWEIRET